jgi:hypothetical protein
LNLEIKLPICVEEYNFLKHLYHVLRVHDNGIRRRAFGPQGEHVMGDWRKMWNGETLKLLFSSYIVLLGQLYTIVQNFNQKTGGE